MREVLGEDGLECLEIKIERLQIVIQRHEDPRMSCVFLMGEKGTKVLYSEYLRTDLDEAVRAVEKRMAEKKGG